MRRLSLAAAGVVMLTASGCMGLSTSEESTIYGAGAGTAAGAGIGYAVGGPDGWWLGALAGTAVGAASGYLIGNEIEKDEATDRDLLAADRNRRADAALLRRDNRRRDESPRYYAYSIDRGNKFMIYDVVRDRYWSGVYSIPRARHGAVAKINGKWVEVRLP
ncbi:MAG: hypothetical protein JO317_06300 [Verrucomicrobiae bacterium]|nr:hypothetical protein [Verrucomicrobiae bacterium]